MKIINTNHVNIINLIIEKLEIGDLILSSKYKNKSYYISPSPVKHISVYYGSNLRNRLEQMKLKVISDSQESQRLFDHHVFIKKKLLENIDIYIPQVNNDDHYIIEIQMNKFNIKEVKQFLQNKDEIVTYKPLIKHPITFANFYLYFIGNEYSVFYQRGKRYCFESVISLLAIMNDFINNEGGFMRIIYIRNFSILDNRLHFNSLSISKNPNFKKKNIYKDGILKLI